MMTNMVNVVKGVVRSAFCNRHAQHIHVLIWLYDSQNILFCFLLVNKSALKSQCDSSKVLITPKLKGFQLTKGAHGDVSPQCNIFNQEGRASAAA